MAYEAMFATECARRREGRCARPTAALDIYASGDVAGEGGRAAHHPPLGNAAPFLALLPLLTCPVRGEQRGEERSRERRAGDCKRLRWATPERYI
jgi:hypothetical protein